MGKSYAYDPENPGHKYIHSTELDEDLAKCAKEMKKKKIKICRRKLWKS